MREEKATIRVNLSDKIKFDKRRGKTSGAKQFALDAENNWGDEEGITKEVYKAFFDEYFELNNKSVNILG